MQVYKPTRSSDNPFTHASGSWQDTSCFRTIVSEISLLGRIHILRIEEQDYCTLDDASLLRPRTILNKDRIWTTCLGHR